MRSLLRPDGTYRTLLLVSTLALVACGSTERDRGSPEPVSPRAEASPAPGLAEVVPPGADLTPLAVEARDLLRARQSANLLLAVGTPTRPPRFVYREVDLDGDDPPEIRCCS